MKPLNKNRRCGKCDLCCELLGINELDPPSPEGERCSHQCGFGCDIYKDRPQQCQDFVCLWRAGMFANADRPDKIGAFFTTTRHEKLGDILVVHGRRGSWRSDMLIKLWARQGVVILVPPDPKADRRVICHDYDKSILIRQMLPELLKKGV